MAYDEYHVITAAILDREHRNRYRLAFVCRDAGLPSLFSVKHLTVEILDVNDNAPKFLQHSYSVDVYENDIPGEPLLTVNATDPDFGENSELTYFFAENFALPFTVNSTTGIFISRILKLGGYRQMFGGCKHARSPNLYYKNIKNRKITLSQVGVVSQLGGYLPPRMHPQINRMHTSAVFSCCKLHMHPPLHR